MSPAQIRFLTLVRRETTRFWKIKRQTLGAPLLETFLYISVFGAALGSRIDKLHGVDYVVFIIPGLIMMAWATNAFAQQLVVAAAAEVPALDRRPALLARLAAGAAARVLARRLPAREDRRACCTFVAVVDPGRRARRAHPRARSRRCSSSASSSPSSACSSACAPSSSTT